MTVDPPQPYQGISSITPPVSGRERFLGLLHLALLAGGLGAVLYGFISSAPLGQELWDGRGRRHFLVLLLCVAPIALAIPWILRNRWPLGCVLVAGLATMLTLGVLPVLAVLFMLASSVCLGWLTLGRSLEDGDRVTSFALNALIGFGLLSLFLNIAVHFPINTQSLYVVLLAAPIFLGRRYLRTLWNQAAVNVMSGREIRVPLALLGALLGIVLATHLVVVALPERYHDALAMHLHICTTVAHDHFWAFDCASFAPAAMPMNGDLFYMVGYQLSGEPGARLVNFLFFLLMLALLYGEVRRRCGTACAILSATLIASIPVAFLETGCLYIENVLAAFVLGGFILLIREMKERRGTNLMALGVLLGAVASTKLHGVFLASVMLGVAAVVLVPASGLRTAWRLVAPAVFIAGLVGIPPYLSAFQATGNPVFPLFNNIFKSPLYPASGLDLLQYPWEHLHWHALFDVTFHTHRYMEGMDGAIGFYFLCLGLAAVMCWVRRDRVAMLALVIAVGYLLFIGRYCFYVRYIYPVFSLLTIACVGPGLAQAGARTARWATFALGLGCVAVNLYFMPSAAPIFRVFDYETVLSETERSKALDASVPERRLVEVVNTVAGDQARVLFVGSPYAAGLWGKAYYANWYGPLFLEQLGEARQPDDVTRLLQRMGITHAIVSRGAELPHPELFDPVFATQMTLLLNVNGACLYTFEPEAGSGAGHIDVAGGLNPGRSHTH